MTLAQAIAAVLLAFISLVAVLVAYRAFSAEAKRRNIDVSNVHLFSLRKDIYRRTGEEEFRGLVWKFYFRVLLISVIVGALFFLFVL
jgi:hypothetical protein